MHAVVVHGDAVAYADGADLERARRRPCRCRPLRLRQILSRLLWPGMMSLARVEDRDERTLHFLIGESVGLKQAAVGSSRPMPRLTASLRSCTLVSRFLAVLDTQRCDEKTRARWRCPSLDAYDGRLPAKRYLRRSGPCGGDRWPCAFARGCSRECSEPSTAGSQVRLLAVGWMRLLLALSSHLLVGGYYTGILRLTVEKVWRKAGNTLDG